MFDINDPSLTRTKPDPSLDNLPSQDLDNVAGGNTADQPGLDTVAHPFDAPDMMDRHRVILSYYRQEIDRQIENRFQMAVDEDYYDHIQWTEEEAQVLRDRGQAPLVYNVICQSVNWVTGSEKRGRTDFLVLPRNSAQLKTAQLKTKLLKYVSDVNRLTFHRSRAFEDAVKVGIGWLEDGIQHEDEGEPLYSRYESWRNILWDSSSTEMDLSDARYIFRMKWVDTDVAIAHFPDRKAVIEESFIDASHYSSFDLDDGDMPMDYAEFERENHGISRNIVTSRRRRVRLIEAQYRVPMTVKILKGGHFNGDIYNPEKPHPLHALALQAGHSILAERTKMVVRVMILTTQGVLYEGITPYRHNRFSFVPIWGYRRGRDGLPYGLIRGMRDIQDDINKSASKSLHILSSNKTIMEEGALPDDVTLEDYAEEVSRPDAIIVKKAGKQLEINADRDLAPAHAERMSQSIRMLQQVGGVTDELMGQTTNAVSGVAVEARQNQGSVQTNKLFDNLRFSYQVQGENQLSLIEQFYTAQKVFRITDDRGTPDFHTVNSGLPHDDIAATKADFVISEQSWQATIRQAATQQLTEMLMKMPPNVALVLLDLVVDSMDIPNRDEIVKRIRAVNGQKDPDQQEPTPEDLQKQQEQAEAAAYQKQMALANLDNLQAKTEQIRAQARRTDALMVGDAMLAANTAMEAATAVLTMPSIARVADNLLIEGGWQRNPAIQGLPAQPGMPDPNNPQGLLPAQPQPGQPVPGPAGAPAPIPQPAPGQQITPQQAHAALAAEHAVPQLEQPPANAPGMPITHGGPAPGRAQQ